MSNPDASAPSRRELLSVQELAVYYYDSNCELEEALAKEKTGNAKAKRLTERASQSLEDEIWCCKVSITAYRIHRRSS